LREKKKKMRIALTILLICTGVAVSEAFTMSVDDQEMTMVGEERSMLSDFFVKNVTVNSTTYLGRPALKLAFTDAYQQYLYTANVANGEAYFRIPLSFNFYEGTIDVDIAAENNQYADDSSRAFAGVIFHQQLNDQSDIVYLRMLNGRLNNPPPPSPRIDRALQYMSLPQWTFDKLREQFPGKYETGADVAEKRWVHLRLVVKNNTVSAFIDYATTPVVQQLPLLGANAPGWVALFVDDATDAYFSNLRIRRSMMM